MNDSGSDHGVGTARVGSGVVTADFLADVVHASFDPYVVLDRVGTILYVGDSIDEILGVPPAALLGRNMLEVLAPESRDAVISAFAEFTSPEKPFSGWIGPALTVRLQHALGHAVSCRVLAVPSGKPDFDGLVLRVRWTESNERLDAAIASLVRGDPISATLTNILEFATEQMPYSVGVIALGHDGARFESTVAHPKAPLQHLDTEPLPAGESMPWHTALELGQPVYADTDDLPEPIRTELTDAGIFACWAYPLDHTTRVADVLVFWRLAPGEPGPHLAEAIERIIRLSQLALDADHNRRLLERQANTDELTGLANRNALAERLTALEREPPTDPIGVLYCDLDNFKPVNDRLGHLIGDQVLQAAAQRIAGHVRSGDVACRIGGDEFAVLCSASTPAQLTDLADRLVEAFDPPITVRGHQVELGISVGLALIDPRSQSIDPERIMARADAALLRAKASGKGRWNLADRAG